MPKVSFQNRAAPAQRQVSRSFPDPEHPSEPEVVFTIAKPSVLTEAAIQERAAAAIERWVPAAGRKVNAHPALLAAGYPLEYLSGTMVKALAVLESVQVGPADERYDFDELLDMALRCPQLWKAVSEWANDALEGTFDPGNSSAAGAETSSSPPSDTGSPTPESSSTETPASAASTNGSVISADSPAPSPVG